MTPAARMRMVDAVAVTGYAMTAKGCATTLAPAGGMLAEQAIEPNAWAWGFGVGGAFVLLAVWVLSLSIHAPVIR